MGLALRFRLVSWDDGRSAGGVSGFGWSAQAERQRELYPHGGRREWPCVGSIHHGVEGDLDGPVGLDLRAAPREKPAVLTFKLRDDQQRR